MLEEMIWWGQQTDQNLTLDFGLGESKELDIASNKNNIWAAVEDFLEEDLAFCVCPTEFVVYLEPTDWNTQAIGDPKKIKWKKMNMKHFTLWVIRGIMRETKVAASLLLMKVHKDYISNFFGGVSITH